MAAVKRVKLREPQTNFAPYVVNLPKTMTVRIVGVNIVTGAPEHKGKRRLVPTKIGADYPYQIGLTPPIFLIFRRPCITTAERTIKFAKEGGSSCPMLHYLAYSTYKLRQAGTR